VLAPQFTAIVQPQALVELTRRRSAAYGPLRIVGLESNGNTRRAASSTGRTTSTSHLHRRTQPRTRIASTWVAGLVPAHLTPRLRWTSPSIRCRRVQGRRLIVF